MQLHLRIVVLVLLDFMLPARRSPCPRKLPQLKS